MNVKLLRRVAKHILAEPKRLRMMNWVLRGDPGEILNLADGWGEPASVQLPSCGTVGCIAGWTCILSGKDTNSGVTAQGLLKIDDDAAETLFYVDGWRPTLKARYLKAKRPRTRAKIVAEVIEDFIKTGE